MKASLFVLTILATTVLTAYSQPTKVLFEVDGTDFLSIRTNADGYNLLYQGPTQTSMFFGYSSGQNNMKEPSLFGSGDFNTAYGYATLSSNTTGQRNTAIGTNALRDNVTGITNTAIGFFALSGGVSGNDNIGIGKSALRSNIDGDFNIAIGSDAFNNTNFANRSIALGATAGVNDTSSVDNVYIGFGAGRGTVFATDGYDRSENTIVGTYAGFSNSTSGNVFLGNEAGRNAGADNQLYITNSDTDSLNTLIYGQFDNGLLRFNGEVNIDGLYAFPTTAPSSGDVLQYTGGDNLSWSSLDHPWEFGSGSDVLYEDGDVGIGLGNAIYRLDVADNVNNGYVARFRNANTTSASKGIIIQTGPNSNPTSSSYYALFLDGNGTNIGGIRGNGTGGTMYSTTSDRRLKQNIRPFESGLSMLADITPAIYQMKSNPNEEEIGFIAQDLQHVLPYAVGGNPTDDAEESPMTVDYGRITPVLAAAIKEQQQLIENLTKQLDAQNKQLHALKDTVDQLLAKKQKN